MKKTKIGPKEGSSNALKTGETVGCKIDKLLKNNGIDLKALSPKMEHYTNILDWSEDSKAYMISKAKIMKEYIELAHTLGGKALEIQDEITKISIFLNAFEKKLLEKGTNPLESKEYINALKLKKELIIEKNKLNLEYGKAATDYAVKKSNNPEAFDGDSMW